MREMGLMIDSRRLECLCKGGEDGPAVLAGAVRCPLITCFSSMSSFYQHCLHSVNMLSH